MRKHVIFQSLGFTILFNFHESRVGFYEGNKTCFLGLDFPNFGPFFSELPKIGQNAHKTSRQKSKIHKTSFVPLIKPNSHAKNHGN